MTIVHENGNRLLPKVTLDKRVFKELCNPWKDSLVIKLLGKSIGYNMMKDKLKKVWKPAGGFDILDVDNGFYMVKFDMPADREKALSDGPWMLYDHYLAVSQWTPEFVSPEAKVDRTTVWIRFPGLNLVYYDESVLLALASAVGKPIKVDTNTLKVQRGRFARICVEIDLNQPVVGKVWVDGFWYKVSYEGLHIICSNCGCYGHLGRNCKSPPSIPTPPPPEQPKEPKPAEEETISGEKEKGQEEADQASLGKQDVGAVYGEWLVVSRRKRTSLPPKVHSKSNMVAYVPNGFENMYTPSKAIDLVGPKGKGVAFNAPGASTIFTSPTASRPTKSGWKVKKRRHDEGTFHQIAPPTPTRVTATESSLTTQTKETSNSQKGTGSTPQVSPLIRKPLQESNKQNIIPSPTESGPTLKGPKAAINSEQLGPIHSNLARENKPPGAVFEPMDFVDEDKALTATSPEELMHVDSDMGMVDASKNAQ